MPASVICHATRAEAGTPRLQSAGDFERFRRLCDLCARIARTAYVRGLLTPTQDALIRACPAYHQPPVLLLVFYGLRWGELSRLDRFALWTWKGQQLATSKGSLPRDLPPLPKPAGEPDHPWYALLPLTPNSDQSVAGSISYAAHSIGLVVARPCKHGTHLPRHLFAATMRAQGRSDLEIQRELGHRRLASTAYYLLSLDERSLLSPPFKE
jgi:integrase